jgi:hypothetical protein
MRPATQHEDPMHVAALRSLGMALIISLVPTGVGGLWFLWTRSGTGANTVMFCGWAVGCLLLGYFLGRGTRIESALGTVAGLCTVFTLVPRNQEMSLAVRIGWVVLYYILLVAGYGLGRCLVARASEQR